MPEEMATRSQHARVHMTRVIERRELATGVVLLRLDAPELANATRPGQYVMAIPPSGEAAATALAIYEAEGKLASLLFFVMGRRTRELAALSPGDCLNVLGPLGNGFDCSGNVREVAIVAGGVGIASVLLCAQRLLAAGKRVRLFYGAKTRELLVDAQRFGDAGCELIVTTDDGTDGTQGLVTDALAISRQPEMIFACGPTPMLRSVARVAGEFGTPAQLALEETFGCGVGACWGCVVPLIGKSSQAPGFPRADRGGSDVVYARICREGPVFWAHELRW
ncbi:MAG: dihydroorotate dehydrogenase electron transfer subunit [Candidatus Eremiobacteraeota bacterium]|nr:dihydroorotate dehydrogenase electron transfer subunit [Candidatus Eremiobacteraeota bacterium]